MKTWGNEAIRRPRRAQAPSCEGPPGKPALGGSCSPPVAPGSAFSSFS